EDQHPRNPRSRGRRPGAGRGRHRRSEHRRMRGAGSAGRGGSLRRPDGAAPYVYRGDWRETKAHFDAVIAATPLACMLYNNPIAYGTDVTATQLGELVSHENLQAVKES